MRTKNAKAITHAEREHMRRVKGLPCSVCGATAPSDAHHIEQGLHFLVIPTCRDCHMGAFNGIHGQKRIWNAVKKTELSCLNETIRSMCDGVV